MKILSLWLEIQKAGLLMLAYLACVVSFLLLIGKVAESFESGRLGRMLDAVLESLFDGFVQAVEFIKRGR